MPIADDQITIVEKATSPTQTIVAKATGTPSIIEKATSPTQTIVAKPFSSVLTTENYISLLTESGEELLLESA